MAVKMQLGNSNAPDTREGGKLEPRVIKLCCLDQGCALELCLCASMGEEGKGGGGGEGLEMIQ